MLSAVGAGDVGQAAGHTGVEGQRLPVPQMILRWIL